MATTAPAPDELLRTVSTAGGIAVRVVVGTELVADAVARHLTSPTAGVALGRALMGAVLFAAGSKQGETAQLHFRGDGPLGSLTAIADSEGRVRGYATHPEASPPAKSGVLDVSAAVGRGVLSVVRHHPDWREPYTGIVPIATGTVARDLAAYLAQSEQQRAAVALGVFVDGRGGIEAAAGFSVHVLPGAAPEEVERAEANVQEQPGPGELVRGGLGADDIASLLLEGLGSRDRHRTHPAFHCPCGRDRVLRTITLLGREEIRGITARGESLEIRCEFCGTRYTVTGDEIGALFPDA
jgi:molecular chaperone Hsp33